MKTPTPNRDMVFRSTVTALQNTWTEYKRLLVECYRYLWIDDDGGFVFLNGMEERKRELIELHKEVVRLLEEIERMRGEHP